MITERPITLSWITYPELIMFRRVLRNCTMSVSETTKTQNKQTIYSILKNIHVYKRKKINEKILNQILKEITYFNFNNESLSWLINKILFPNFKQLSYLDFEYFLKLDDQFQINFNKIHSRKMWINFVTFPLSWFLAPVYFRRPHTKPWTSHI